MSKSDPPDSSVPAGRFSRLARLGALAGGVAGGMLAEGARQLAQGKRPQAKDLLLTPQNAKRVADQLAQLRGAAMKMGQLLSMDAGDLLPPELTDILARLRSDARAMPLSQVAQILTANWGNDWQQRFKQFSFQPLAAASIGQVHSAHTQDGRHLALKIQYPGVRQSIDSDVDNVVALLRLSGLVPKEILLESLLTEAKRQLHSEADYQQEASWLKQYGHLLADAPEFLLPSVQDDLTTETILAMSYVGGVPVEHLNQAPQAERDRIIQLLLQLLFRELFEFRLVQTDPNFANYRYASQTQQLVLLDFGATRAYSDKVSEGYKQLLSGAMHSDFNAMNQAAEQIGFFQADIHPTQRQWVLDMFHLGCEPLRQNSPFDFAASGLATRVRETGMQFSMDQKGWHTPPVDALFLHRKMGGLYLLAAKLRAKTNVQALFAPYL